MIQQITRIERAMADMAPPTPTVGAACSPHGAGGAEA